MTWKDELEIIRTENEGILRPSDTVDFARNPETELHKKFEWDDTRAGHEHRLWQARQIIRAVVYFETREDKVYSVNMYHPVGPAQIQGEEEHLPSSRERGYDTLVNIMSDSERCQQLLDQAYAEMRTFKKKYQELKELAPLFEVMEKLAV